MKNQIIIIATTLFFLIASMLFLAYTEKNQRAHDEDFWSVYFVAPLAESGHAFVIDNRSADTTFYYTITSNEKEITTGSAALTKGSRILINPAEINIPSPIVVTVMRGDEKKVIEKK